MSMNVPAESRPATEYLFGAGDEEIARLLERAGRRRLASEVLLDQLAVAPGWNVLDVGCGPLGILDLLANEEVLLSALTDDEREHLAGLLRKLLFSFEHEQSPSPFGMTLAPTHITRRARTAVGLSDRAGLLV